MNILELTKLNTIEDAQDQKALKELSDADTHAGDLMIGGSLLAGDAGRERLDQACSHLTRKDLCRCEACETSSAVTWDRQRAAYFVGLAVGLRLARATDPVATDAGGAR